jgi:hypothetical protein
MDRSDNYAQGESIDSPISSEIKTDYTPDDFDFETQKETILSILGKFIVLGKTTQIYVYETHA